ncbi:hypothetical protein [Paraburkholderia haematera]|nr:hypothetical protein [Paraburkholderia haematera]
MLSMRCAEQARKDTSFPRLNRSAILISSDVFKESCRWRSPDCVAPGRSFWGEKMMNTFLISVLPTLKRLTRFGKWGLFVGVFLFIAADMAMRAAGQPTDDKAFAQAVAPILVLLTAIAVIGELAISMIKSHLDQQARH